MASKANGNIDDPGAFPAREWLRKACVGNQIEFETRKQGATAGDRVYGLLFMPSPDNESKMNLAVEAVRHGFATPKVFGPEPDADEPTPEEGDPVLEYERALQSALQEATAEKVGIHSANPVVRSLKNAGDEFQTRELIEKTKTFCEGNSVKCVIEYIFDGSRFRCLITDPDMEAPELQYASFTLILAGVASPRVGNPRLDPPTTSEAFADEAKQFVEQRLLHRELKISLHGTDKSGVCAVGTVHHPRGNIGVELLKKGLARVSDWSSRMMNPLDLPAFRVAENTAKRTNLGVWHAYSPPKLSGAAEILGTVVEVLTGDTIAILPVGEEYDSEAKLKKVSLASVRSPRVGNERQGKTDEPYATECKDRLRLLTVGKSAKIQIHYERDIPMGEKTEKRQFGTISVGKKADIGEVLVTEGLAITQHHRDNEEKSPRYDALIAAEMAAKTAKKCIHATVEYKKGTTNDLTDPKKSKAYSGSLMRAGTLKAVVEYVFNGSRFKLFVPNENCHIVFALENLKSPQPSLAPGAISRGQVRPAEPFGDASKRHARLSVLQRSVEIVCKGVTQGGVITGELFVGAGGQRRNFCLEMIGAGLASVDQRKIEYGEVPQVLVNAQTRASDNRVGLWSLEQKKEVITVKTIEKSKEEVLKIRLSEIRDGSHFFYSVIGNEAADVVNESMKLFSSNKGTNGAPVDQKVGKFVAALFNDGSGPSWYRAKIIENYAGKAKVLYIDHGNVAVVSKQTHLRPLDVELSPDRIPAVAKEAVLALTKTRDLDSEEGMDAARLLQNLAWNKDLTARIFCEADGNMIISLYDDIGNASINEQIVSEGLARAPKESDVDSISANMLNNTNLSSLASELKAAEKSAKKSRRGIWRYGDVGDDDEEL